MNKQMTSFSKLAVVFFISGMLSGCTMMEKSSPSKKENVQQTTENPQVSPSPTVEPVEFTARFEIVTNGTKRIFTDSKYHLQSPDVYLEKSNPEVIHVTKAGIRWADFFETLPMELTKECLITGTQQRFCSSDTRTLRFFINEIEASDALDQPIEEGDFLRVVYGQ